MKIFRILKNMVLSVVNTTAEFIKNHKITSAIFASVVTVIITVSIVLGSVFSTPKNVLTSNESTVSGEVSEDVSFVESVVSSEPVVSVESIVSSQPPVVSSKPVAVTPPPVTPPVNTEFKYNSSMSYNNNVFLDALAYTGYKLDRERASGRMWGAFGNYVLCSQKKGLGWLSNITYGGGSTGYEVDALGKPNISRFERGGLVCATYVTYAYFNYLPNVAGIDTSSLTRPNRSYSANDWYNAAKDWVNKGYSRYISFTANDGGSINRDITFNAAEDIPIGSIICLQDWYNRNGHCSHVSIYAGYVNGYHWVTHVGNENGPEFCAIQRMNRKPHPQWPLAIITTPNNIRFAPALEVTITDQDGNAMIGVEVNATSTASGSVINLGITDQTGKVKKEGLTYGEYQITQTVPSEYTSTSPTITINLNTQNNSLNSVSFVNNKIIVVDNISSESTSEVSSQIVSEISSIDTLTE